MGMGFVKHNGSDAGQFILCLTSLFSEDFLRKTARETGFVKRLRKIDPVVMFWVIVLDIGVKSMRGLHRSYERRSGVSLGVSSFIARFDPGLEKFLHSCVVHALECQANDAYVELSGSLKAFKDLLIQDSTIIRLHESLAEKWPAARSRSVAAGVKLSCIVSAVEDGVKSVRVFPERTAEVKTLRLGPWLKDRILLADLGFFDYNSFDKIERYGGFFVSRLKGNANPRIVKVNSVCRGNSIDVVGKKLKDVLPGLKRRVLDVEVEVEVKRRAYKGKTTKVARTFRLVLVMGEDAKEYHSYLTNIPIDKLDGEGIANLYRARWEVELLFKELKSDYRLDEIKFEKPSEVISMIWVAILTLICSRQLLRLMKRLNPAKARLYTHLQWAKIFTEFAGKLMDKILESMNLELDWLTYIDILIDQGQTPNINRERLMDP